MKLVVRSADSTLCTRGGCVLQGVQAVEDRSSRAEHKTISTGQEVIISEGILAAEYGNQYAFDNEPLPRGAGGS